MDYRWDVVRRKEIEAQRKQEELRVLERLLAKLKDGHGADQVKRSDCPPSPC